MDEDMSDNGGCNGYGSGWIWAITIIIIVVVLLLLWLWAWPACEGCVSGRGAEPRQVKIFHVTVEEKDKSHPNYGRGSKFGYVIDGVQGQALVLEAGKLYRFIVRSVDHPFYIGESEKGNKDSEGECRGNIEVTGTPTESGSFPFIPTTDMPQPLYYSCCNHDYMGSSITIKS